MFGNCFIYLFEKKIPSTHPHLFLVESRISVVIDQMFISPWGIRCFCNQSALKNPL